MSLAGFNNSHKLTIDGTKIDGDLTDFPVNITLSSGTGQTGFDTTDVFTELTPTTVASETSLLLHMNGDLSDSERTITTVGTPKLHPSTTFSGFNSLGYMEFDGSTEYLTIPDSVDWEFGSDDFTIGFWVQLLDTSAGRILHQYQNNANRWYVFVQAGTGCGITFNVGGSWLTGFSTFSYPFVIDTWYYIVFIRGLGGSSSNLDCFISGAQQTTKTVSDPLPDFNGVLYIGVDYYDSSPNEYLNGYLSDLYIKTGIADATVSGVVPASPAQPDSYTKFLVNFGGDQSDSQHVITFNGNPQIVSSTGKFEGSYYFDGSPDYLLIEQSTDFDFGTGDFTIDWWQYPTTIDHLRMSRDAGESGTYTGFLITGSPGTLYMSNDGGTWNVASNRSLGTVAQNVWTHYAIVRSGNNFYTFKGGIQQDTWVSALGLFAGQSGMRIGIDRSGYSYYTGYAGEFRVIKGTALWTEDFTAPQGPPGSSWENRKKIAITDSSYNQLYTEIERWDYANEEANLWVKVPTIASGTDTDLYLYYDITATTNSGYVGGTGDSPAQQVWDDNFVGVWHMAQDPSGGSDAILDSTSNINHVTSAGSMESEDLVGGKIGKAIEFSGSSQYLTRASTDFTGIVSAMTAEYTGNFDVIGTSSNDDIVLDSRIDDQRNFLMFVSQSTSEAHFRIYNTGGHTDISSTTTLSPSNWYNVVGTFDGDAVAIHVNGGSAEDSDSGASMSYQTGKFNIAIDRGGNPVTAVDGKLDEIRISKIKRSNGWIKATYYSNWDDLVTFAPLGPPPLIVSFVFSNPIPTHLSTVYGIAHQLQLTTTVTGTGTGSGGPFPYDAAFYDAFDDSPISQTTSGVQSGQYLTTTMSTPLGTDYNWYLTATASGQSDTSSTYTFTNRFLCSGYTQVAGTGASGIPVRLYRRSTGAYIGGVISSGVSGTFDIITDYNEDHYAVAMYPTSGTNALIADWLKPSN